MELGLYIFFPDVYATCSFVDLQNLQFHYDNISYFIAIVQGDNRFKKKKSGYGFYLMMFIVFILHLCFPLLGSSWLYTIVDQSSYSVSRETLWSWMHLQYALIQGLDCTKMKTKKFKWEYLLTTQLQIFFSASSSSSFKKKIQWT